MNKDQYFEKQNQKRIAFVEQCINQGISNDTFNINAWFVTLSKEDKDKTDISVLLERIKQDIANSKNNMKQTPVTLTNYFHNTQATLMLIPIESGRFAGKFSISAESAKIARKKLCPRNDCKCGGTFGERGGAYLSVVNQDSNNNYIIDLLESHI